MTKTSPISRGKRRAKRRVPDESSVRELRRKYWCEDEGVYMVAMSQLADFNHLLRRTCQI